MKKRIGSFWPKKIILKEQTGSAFNPFSKRLFQTNLLSRRTAHTAHSNSQGAQEEGKEQVQILAAELLGGPAFVSGRQRHVSLTLHNIPLTKTSSYQG